MSYVGSLEVYVNKVEDLRGVVAEDVVEVVEELIDVRLEEEYDGFYENEEEIEYLRKQAEQSRKNIQEQRSILLDLDKQLDEVFNYIADAKRLNRDKLKSMLAKVDLSKVSDELHLNI